MRLRSSMGKTESRAGRLVSMHRTSTEMIRRSGAHNNDVFDEDLSDDEAPGPGQYYNPNLQTCFKKNIADPRLQKFGSSVDRFQDPFETKQV